MIQLKKEQITIQPDNKKTDDTVEEKINDSISDKEKSDDKKKIGKGVNNKFVIIIYTVRVRYL